MELTSIASHDRKKRRLLMFASITFGFMFVELIAGLSAHSLSLVSDAIHMLCDSLALFVSLFAAIAASWRPNSAHSFGFKRYETIAAFVNGVILIYVAGMIVTEAIKRLWQPRHVHTQDIYWVSLMGMGVNLVGLFAFHDVAHSHGGSGGHALGTPLVGGCSHAHSHDGAAGVGCHSAHGAADDRLSCAEATIAGGTTGTEQNFRGVYLHIMADLLGSIAVIVGNVLIELTGFHVIDPLCSMVLSALVARSAWTLIRQTASVLIHEEPAEAVALLRRKLQEVPGLRRVERLSMWCVTGSDDVVATVACSTDGAADPWGVKRAIVDACATVGANPALTFVQVT